MKNVNRGGRKVRFGPNNASSTSTNSPHSHNSISSKDKPQTSSILKKTYSTKKIPPQSPTSSNVPNKTKSSSNDLDQSINSDSSTDSGSSWLSIFSTDTGSTNSSDSFSSWLGSTPTSISSTLSPITSLLSHLPNFSDTQTPESSPNNSGDNSPQRKVAPNSQDGEAINISSAPPINFPKAPLEQKETKQTDNNPPPPLFSSALSWITTSLTDIHKVFNAFNVKRKFEKTSGSDNLSQGSGSEDREVKTSDNNCSTSQQAGDKPSIIIRRSKEDKVLKKSKSDNEEQIKVLKQTISTIENNDFMKEHKYYQGIEFKSKLDEATIKHHSQSRIIKEQQDKCKNNLGLLTDYQKLLQEKRIFYKKQVNPNNPRSMTVEDQIKLWETQINTCKKIIKQLEEKVLARDNSLVVYFGEDKTTSQQSINQKTSGVNNEKGNSR